MFKNLMLYRAADDWSIELDAMEAALATMPFTPCEGAQEKTYGWVPPRGVAHGCLVESINRQRIMCFAIETKSVPGAVIKRDLDAHAAQIEAEQGRKPGRKKLRDLREEVVRQLLPHAFPKHSRVWVWFNPQTGHLALDTTSQARADEVITALVRALDGIHIAPLNTEVAPQAVMTSWLLDGDKLDVADRFGFDIGRRVVLESGDEMRSVVKFDRHHLDDDQMRLHIGQGKLPTQLALSWKDRVSFTLTKNGTLQQIKLLDVPLAEDADDTFDSDVVIATGELQPLIADLVETLGGELA